MIWSSNIAANRNLNDGKQLKKKIILNLKKMNQNYSRLTMLVNRNLLLSVKCMLKNIYANKKVKKLLIRKCSTKILGRKKEK